MGIFSFETKYFKASNVGSFSKLLHSGPYSFNVKLYFDKIDFTSSEKVNFYIKCFGCEDKLAKPHILFVIYLFIINF